MKNNKLNPWYISGYSDGEGNFSITMSPANDYNFGWSINPRFMLVASYNSANYNMFEQIQQFFGVGSIFIENGKYIRFIVSGLTNCLIIREHFINYPLLTYKLVHFQLWSTILDLMLTKNHLSLEGLYEIIALKAHFKEGLSELLLKHFPNYPKIPVPDYTPNLSLINIQWLSGFINADGSFSLTIRKGDTKLGETYNISIKISQDIISLITLEHIISFLGIGKIYKCSGTVYDIKIRSLSNINLFIDKFKEAKLLGAKKLDYLDFCRGIELINNGKHLSKEGLETIRSISDGMNSKRTKF